MAILILPVFFLILIFGIIFIFSSKRISPIPYFPSNKMDLNLIIKSLSLKNNQIVFDLGAGDGIVIFNSAKIAQEKNLNTEFIAVEINPILLAILHIRRLFHPNKEKIKILNADIFTMNFNSLIRKPARPSNPDPVGRSGVNSLTVYLYISPWYLEKVISNLKFQISNFIVVSYMYPIKSLKKKEKKIKGKNLIYLYS